MKIKERLDILRKDERQAANFFERFLIFLKLLYYSIERPAANFFMRRRLKVYSMPSAVLDYVDLFLRNEGGMFKQYAYGLCDRLSSLKNSAILVPGVGYGRNLFQLAAWRPKIIAAFDLYEYKDEWDFLKQEIKEKFGVEIIFLKGDFEALGREWLNSFDFIITDAVLEHVRDLRAFASDAGKFLKSGGIFYASFGPLWFSPGGDHISWGEEKLFDHLLLSEEEYEKQFREKFDESKITADSCESVFMIKEKLFSFLRVNEYIQILEEAGFRKVMAYAKISSQALRLKEKRPDLFKLLDTKGFPAFDRFCSGMYLWLRLEK